MMSTDQNDPSSAEGPLAFPATGLELKHAAERNRGWYGDRLLMGEERLSDVCRAPVDRSRSGESATSAPGGPKPRGSVQDQAAIFVKMAPSRHIRDMFARAMPHEARAHPQKRTAVTVMTAGLSDLLDFKRSAAALAMVWGWEDDCYVVAWHVQVRDDEQQRTFASVVPEQLRSLLRWHRDPLMDAEQAEPVSDVPSEHWMILLRPGDMILMRFVEIFKFYVRRYPQCRCIFPPAASFDTTAGSLSFLRNCDPSRIFETENFPHIAMVRRDCWQSVQEHDSRNSLYDPYALALQVSVHEPILLTPEYLAGRFVKNNEVASREREDVLIARRLLLCEFAKRFPSRPVEVSDQLRPKVRSGLCIIRTQGRDLDLLQESLGSIEMQMVPMTACVVVHGPKTVYDEIARWLDQRRDGLVLLHAWRSERNRGYPLNVGLDYLRQNADAYDFFCFLDDDDIFYPLYSVRLACALFNNQADIVYGLSNQRTPWLDLQPGHVAKPTGFLIAGNFIPIHAYIARTSVILNRCVRFREDMDYLEDWDFLISLIKTSVEITHLPEVVCEYRVIQDGNSDHKRDAGHYEECRDRVLALGQSTALHLGPRRILLDLANFDLTALSDPSPIELEHARQTWAMTLSSKDA